MKGLTAIRRTHKTTLILAAAVTLMAGQLQAAENTASDGWEFMVAPLFLWGMSIDGTAEIDGTEGDLNLDFKDDILENMEGAFTIHFEARKRDLWLFAEYQYVNLQPSVSGEIVLTSVAVDIDFTVQSAELGAGYTLSKSDTTRWEVLGGLRWIDHDIKADIDGPAFLPSKIEGGDDWIQGFLGGRVTTKLTDSWSFSARADVGYGGSDNTTYHLNTTFDYRFKGWGSAFVGLRYMDFDYAGGGYAYDAKQQGPIVGLAIYW